MEKTGPTVSQKSQFITEIPCELIGFSDMDDIFFNLIPYVCLFSATGAIQEEVVHTVLNEQEAYIF